MQSKALIISLVIIGYLIYFFSPIDLIPDFTGLFGKLDDFALLGYLIWLLRKHLRAKEKETETLKEQVGSEPDWLRSKDPYQILGISREATVEEVKGAYKKLASQYHPDKVTHLGADFQDLANKKFQKIEWAYKELVKG